MSEMQIEREDEIIADLQQSFSKNNMILFVGVNADENDLTETLCDLPWSCVVTSKRDEEFGKIFINEVRKPREYAKAEELPSKIYDRSALPIVRLFGVENKDQDDDEEDTEIFMERLEDECKNMLSAVMSKLDIISQMIIVGYSPDNKNDIRRGALVVRWEKSAGGVISLFGMDSTTDEGQKLKKSADKMGYHWYEESLTAMLERQNIEASSVDDFRMIPENNLFYKGGRPASISSSQLLRYRNIGELLTEEKIYSVRPLGRIQQSRWFLNFLTRSSVDGPQWYGYLRQSEFYLKRNFEEILVDLVLNILSGKAMSVPGYSTPVVLHGDPGSGKSVILGALAYRVFMKKVNPVIFIHKKELNLGTDLEELDQMMQDIENAGEADTRILLIWDGAAYRNVEKNAKNFARQLDNRGRRFVLVCSAYRNVALASAVGSEKYRYVEGRFEKNSEGNDVVHYNKCYFVQSQNDMTEKEAFSLRQKVKEYLPKESEFINKCWRKLEKEDNKRLFDYFYQLIVVLQPPLEKGLSREHQQVAGFVQEQLDKMALAKKTKNEPTVNPMKQALAKVGVILNEDEEDKAEKSENYDLNQFNTCVALFSRFKLETPVPLAIHMLYGGQQKIEDSFYSDQNRELFNKITTLIPWIFFRENSDGVFCFYYRSTLEAKIFLEKNPTMPERQIDMICKMLEYYAYSCKSYNSEDFSLKVSLQRLLRAIGPNSDYEPFQNIRNTEHNELLYHLNKIIEKLRSMRNEGIPDTDASFATIEVTFIREYYGTCWERINNFKNISFNEDELANVYRKRIGEINEAETLANNSIEQLEHMEVKNYSKRQIASQINSLTVEVCKCSMMLERLIEEYENLPLRDGGDTEEWKIPEPIPYNPLYRMLLKSLNSDPLNGYTYNALFNLFKKEYERPENSRERKFELLSNIRIYVDDAMTFDIQDRGSAGIDELGRNITDIMQYSNKTKVRIKDICNNTCEPEFKNLFDTMLDQNNPSAIIFICQQELDDAQLNVRYHTGKDIENNREKEFVLNESQLKKCEEIREFMTSKKYADCIESSSHALYLLLRVSWMCYNKRPLLDGWKKECRLTYLNERQWRDIHRICQLYENCTDINRKPIVVLLHALSIIQVHKNFNEAYEILESLNEDLFFATARMRVPYMYCNPEGVPYQFTGQVIEAEKFKGFIDVHNVKLYRGRKRGIRFFAKNIGESTAPATKTLLDSLEIGIGYTGFSLYTAKGRKRLEEKGE